MRHAVVLQNWQRLRNAGHYTTRIESVEFSGIRGIIDGRAELKGPITAVCGFNGVGKSVLLKAIWSTLDKHSAAAEADFGERLNESIVEIAMRANNFPIRRTLNKGDDSASDAIPENIQVMYYDCASEALKLQGFFRSFTSIQDILNGVDPEVLDTSALGRHSYVIGKEYTSAELYELDAFEPLVPFFVVTERDAVKYDTRSMSLGEISTFLLLWKLDRLSNNSISLIEEPETYVSAAAQRNMMHVLVDISLKKRISIVLSTHSPQLVENLREDELLILYSGAFGSTFLEQARYAKFLRRLGLQRSSKYLIFVEDAASLRLCSHIIRQNDFGYASDIEILSVGGEANITLLREKIPRGATTVVFVGAYDGDMEGRISSSPELWPCLFLPGKHALELELKRLVESDLEAASQYLGCDPNDLDFSLSAVRGLEHHDWVPELAKSLEMPSERVWDRLVEYWLDIPENHAKASEFARQLSEYLV